LYKCAVLWLAIVRHRRWSMLYILHCQNFLNCPPTCLRIWLTLLKKSHSSTSSNYVPSLCWAPFLWERDLCSDGADVYADSISTYHAYAGIWDWFLLGKQICAAKYVPMKFKNNCNNLFWTLQKNEANLVEPSFMLLKGPSKNGVNCGNWFKMLYVFIEIEGTWNICCKLW
jgi:hypothetical protein